MKNKDCITEIDVKLEESEDEAKLCFAFESPIYLSLTNSDSEQLKRFFIHLMSNLTDGKFKLNFDSDEKDIYSNISRSYIEQLNVEIDSIYSEIPSKD